MMVFMSTDAHHSHNKSHVHCTINYVLITQLKYQLFVQTVTILFQNSSTFYEGTV